jgi:hypothetical protein
MCRVGDANVVEAETVSVLLEFVPIETLPVRVAAALTVRRSDVLSFPRMVFPSTWRFPAIVPLPVTLRLPEMLPPPISAQFVPL